MICILHLPLLNLQHLFVCPCQWQRWTVTPPLQCFCGLTLCVPEPVLEMSAKCAKCGMCGMCGMPLSQLTPLLECTHASPYHNPPTRLTACSYNKQTSSTKYLQGTHKHVHASNHRHLKRLYLPVLGLQLLQKRFLFSFPGISLQQQTDDRQWLMQVQSLCLLCGKNHMAHIMNISRGNEELYTVVQCEAKWCMAIMYSNYCSLPF